MQTVENGSGLSLEARTLQMDSPRVNFVIFFLNKLPPSVPSYFLGFHTPKQLYLYYLINNKAAFADFEKSVNFLENPQFKIINLEV